MRKPGKQELISFPFSLFLHFWFPHNIFSLSAKTRVSKFFRRLIKEDEGKMR